MMNEFRVTFGSQYAREAHPTWMGAHPDGWFTILASDFEQARVAALHLFGTAWSDIAHEATFTADDERTHYPAGELGRADTKAIVGLRGNPGLPEPCQAIPFSDIVRRGAVTSRLMTQGMVINGRYSLGHPAVMNDAEVRELIEVIRDLLATQS